MAALNIIEPARLVEGGELRRPAAGKAHVVTTVNGVAAALDGVAPVISIWLVGAEGDAAQLLRAAEQLLPLQRQAPGMVILDDRGDVAGVAPRAALEKAVLQMRRGEYGALARGLGLRGDPYRLFGDMGGVFVYWECPECKRKVVPRPGREADHPDSCRLHEPPIPMERRVRGGE